MINLLCNNDVATLFPQGQLHLVERLENVNNGVWMFAQDSRPTFVDILDSEFVQSTFASLHFSLEKLNQPPLIPFFILLALPVKN